MREAPVQKQDSNAEPRDNHVKSSERKPARTPQMNNCPRSLADGPKLSALKSRFERNDTFSIPSGMSRRTHCCSGCSDKMPSKSASIFDPLYESYYSTVTLFARFRGLSTIAVTRPSCSSFVAFHNFLLCRQACRFRLLARHFKTLFQRQERPLDADVRCTGGGEG